MKITFRPPCRLGDAPGAEKHPEIVYAHARLWLVLRLEEWEVQRSAHLHFLHRIETGESVGDWHRIDLTSHPLRAVASEDVPPIPAWVEDDLRAWTECYDLDFYRSPGLGLVSEIGESKEDFRRRLRGMMRPGIQRRAEELTADPSPEVSRTRAASVPAGRAAKEDLAGALSKLVGELERRRAGSLAEFARSLELGILLVPEDLKLGAHPRRERMID